MAQRFNLTLYAILLLDLSSTLGCLLVCVVEQSNVGTSFCETVGDGKTDTGTTTGDDSSLSLEREKREQAVVYGRYAVVVHEDSVLVERRAGHCDLE